MMVIYLPIKFEFDWANRFRVKSPETEILTDFELESGNENVDGQTDVRHINLISSVGYMQPP